MINDKLIGEVIRLYGLKEDVTEYASSECAGCHHVLAWDKDKFKGLYCMVIVCPICFAKLRVEVK